MWEVQTQLGNSWENCWYLDDIELQVFDTKEEAETALQEHVSDLQDAIAAGFLNPAADKFRVVQRTDACSL